MADKLPDAEQKLLLACDKLIRKKDVSFALGTADAGVLMVMRPSSKDPKAQMVRSAYSKAHKRTRTKGKLATWGVATWQDGKVLLTGLKNFPAGTKKKIREFAVEYKLKNFVKVALKVEGGEAVPDAEENETETEEEIQKAIAAIEAATPALPDNEEELDQLVDELMREERQQMAESITLLNDALLAVMPPKIRNQRLEELYAQFAELGEPDGMLPATLQIFIGLAEQVLSLMPPADNRYADVEQLNEQAKALLEAANTALTPDQQKLWNRAQSAVHYIDMQKPAFEKYLYGHEDTVLREVPKKKAFQDVFAFMKPLRSALLALQKASDRAAMVQTLPNLRSAKSAYDTASGTKEFQFIATQNPFPVPLPLDTIGDDVQALLGSI